MRRETRPTSLAAAAQPPCRSYRCVVGPHRPTASGGLLRPEIAPKRRDPPVDGEIDRAAKRSQGSHHRHRYFRRREATRVGLRHQPRPKPGSHGSFCRGPSEGGARTKVAAWLGGTCGYASSAWNRSAQLGRGGPRESLAPTAHSADVSQKVRLRHGSAGRGASRAGRGIARCRAGNSQSRPCPNARKCWRRPISQRGRRHECSPRDPARDAGRSSGRQPKFNSPPSALLSLPRVSIRRRDWVGLPVQRLPTQALGHGQTHVLHRRYGRALAPRQRSVVAATPPHDAAQRGLRRRSLPTPERSRSGAATRRAASKATPAVTHRAPREQPCWKRPLPGA